MERTTLYNLETDDGNYHILGVHNGQATLCGFVDIEHTCHDYADHPCNCADCIEALKKIKSMRFPKGYFES